MLKIENLNVKVKDNDELILNDFNININRSEVHVIMGPNGTGKSTLSKIIMGHYKYEITDGNIIFEEEVINDLANQVVEQNLSVRDLESISSNDMAIPKKKPIVRQVVKINKYALYENTLRDKLGVKVSVSENKITIPFDSEGDLNRIFEIFNIDMDEE